MTVPEALERALYPEKFTITCAICNIRQDLENMLIPENWGKLEIMRATSRFVVICPNCIEDLFNRV